AEAARSTLAAVRGGVLRQQNALDAAIARRAQAQDELEGLEPEFETDMTSAEYASAYAAAQRQAAEADAEAADVRDRLHSTEREIEALTAQSSALSRALDVRSGATELVARGVQGIRGLVGDAVQVESGFEAAIAAALGSLAEGVLVESREAARSAAEAARDDDVGIVDIAIADTEPLRPALPQIPGLVPARDVGSAPEGMLGVLAHVLVADDLDAALGAGPALAAAQPAAPLTVVTRAGEVVTAHTLRAGSGQGRSCLELAAERDAANDRLEQIRVVADSLREALADAQQRLGDARARTKTSLETLRAHDAALAAHTERVNRATVRYEA